MHSTLQIIYEEASRVRRLRTGPNNFAVSLNKNIGEGEKINLSLFFLKFSASIHDNLTGKPPTNDSLQMNRLQDMKETASILLAPFIAEKSTNSPYIVLIVFGLSSALVLEEESSCIEMAPIAMLESNTMCPPRLAKKAVHCVASRMPTNNTIN